MAVHYIYNSFGPYEEVDGVKGTTIKFAGHNFFFPFQRTTPIVNFIFREPDHDKSTPAAGEKGELIYQLVPVSAETLIFELLDKQIPYTHKQMGIVPVAGKATGNLISVFAGFNIDGSKNYIEVSEKVATPKEVSEAEVLALRYKEEHVQEYLHSKRETMKGHPGRKSPDKMTRLFMEELGVQDIDDLQAHMKQVSNGLGMEDVIKIAELIAQREEISKAKLEEAVASVRKAGKAQLAPGKPKSLNLAANKEKWEAEHPEEVLK
jgi:hypothetical protein